MSPVRLHAQTPDATQALLDRVRANVATYTATLPSLFCDERFTSKRFADGHQSDSRTTLSTFRVQRGDAVSRESRTVREIDGAPAKGDHIKGPYTLDGGFDRALSLFGESFACFDFHAVASADPAQLHLAYAAKPTLPPVCPAYDAGRTGDITLDPGTSQVLQIRSTFPHPPGVKDSKWNRLDWTVTFAPVTLSGRTFYTPASVRSELFRAGSSEYLQSIAEYANYHKLEVTSNILPAALAPPQ